MKLLLDHPQLLFVVAALAFSFFKRYIDWKNSARDGRSETRQEPTFEPKKNLSRRQMPSVPPPLARTQSPPVLAKTHTPTPLARSHTPATPIKAVPPINRAVQTPDRAILLKRQQDRLDRQQRSKEARTTTSGGAATTRQRIGGSLTHTRTTASALRSQLRNHQEIRKAILINEILGPPVALR